MASICYITPISIHSTRYIEDFKRKGYDIHIIADSYTWVSPKPEAVPVHALPPLTKKNFPQYYIPNLLRIIELLRRINPDLVHLHAQHYYSPAILLCHKPYILTSWGTEVLTLPDQNVLARISSRKAARKASKVTVDAHLLKTLWKQLGIPNNKIEIIPFGVDLKTFNPEVNGYEMRKKLQIEDDEIAFISTRILHDHYNVESFIRAMPLILESSRNVKFIIKGEGPQRAYLKNLADSLGISEHLRFVGLLPHSQMANCLKAADIYISTCFIDTTSVSLLEAMACGLAPIVTDIAGNREWITDGVNGLLFPPRSPQALAEKAIKLINSEDLRKRFGERCYQTVKQRASWTESVTKMECVYESIIGSQR